MNVETITDARTLVLNSGVVGWDWGPGRDADEVLEKLAWFVYREGVEDLTDTALARFVREVLGDAPEDYSLVPGSDEDPRDEEEE